MLPRSGRDASAVNRKLPGMQLDLVISIPTHRFIPSVRTFAVYAPTIPTPAMPRTRDRVRAKYSTALAVDIFVSDVSFDF